MSETKLITLKFTATELWELNCLLANGVCDYSDPSNKDAATAYAKIIRASAKNIDAIRAEKTP